MSDEYRPRLRASRRHPVTRKNNVVCAVCKDAEDAKAIEGLLNDIFKAAVKYEKLDEEIQKLGQKVVGAQLTAEEINALQKPNHDE